MSRTIKKLAISVLLFSMAHCISACHGTATIADETAEIDIGLNTVDSSAELFQSLTDFNGITTGAPATGSVETRLDAIEQKVMSFQEIRCFEVNRLNPLELTIRKPLDCRIRPRLTPRNDLQFEIDIRITGENRENQYSINWDINQLTTPRFKYEGNIRITYPLDRHEEKQFQLNYKMERRLIAVTVIMEAYGSVVLSKQNETNGTCITMNLMGIGQANDATVSVGYREIQYCSNGCPHAGTLSVAGNALQRLKYLGANTAKRSINGKPYSDFTELACQH